MMDPKVLAAYGISPEGYMELSSEEKQAVDQILKEIISGDMSSYDQLYYADYDEKPVDFTTFITDDNYLGKSTRNGTFLYPFWRREIPRIFVANVSEVALSGCLSGDTLIPLIDGTEVPIKDLVGRTNFKVYSYDLNTNQYVVGNAVRAFSTGYKRTYSVTFDNGEVIRITGNHKFLTRDKHYKSIDDGLDVGDSIMPFSRYLNDKGYEILRHPQKDGTFIEEPTHRMVMRSKVGSFKGTVHHKDYNKRNNLPSNLIRMPWKQHRQFHAVRGAERFKEFNRNWNEGNVSEDTKRRYIEGHRKGAISRWSDLLQHEQASERCSSRSKGNQWGSLQSEESRKVRSQRVTKYNKFDHPRVLKLSQITKQEIIDYAQESFTRGQLSQYLGVSRSGLSSLLDKYNITPEVYFRKTPFNLPNRRWTSVLTTYNKLLTEYQELNDDIIREYGYKGLPLVSTVVREYFDGDYQAFYGIVKNFNHKIVSIYLNEVEEVFDIEVEHYHNFALSAGVIVHNSIGVGKTTVAVIMMIYHLYRTMCMKDPQSFFGLAPGTTIEYAFLNNTLGSSYGVAYSSFQAFIQESPWFLKHGKLSGRNVPEYIPEKGFGFVVGSKPQHTLGRAIISAIMDEVSFAPGQSTSYEKSKVMDVYTNIRRRMESRFMVQGKNYGMLFLVSSKATESSFLEAYIADQVRKGYPIYVVDQPLWKVKPAAYSGAMFKVAVGNKYIPSRVAPLGMEGEDLDNWAASATKSGLKIIDVPIEHRQAFDQNLEKALQDIAGISTSAVTKAFSVERILKCVSDKYANPFASEIVTIGLNDNLRLQDFFLEDRIPSEVRGAPIFIHLDASLSGDRTGLGGVAIIGTRQVKTYGADPDEVVESEELVYQQVFDVGIQAPSDSEISFEKTRQFIYYLKDHVGLNIKHVSADGYQSADFRQILSTKGYDTGYTSLDRTPEGYDCLRSAINDQRIVLLKGTDALVEELSELERDNLTRKYDHTAYSTKDISDGVAGALYDASKYKDEFLYFNPSDIEYESINGDEDEADLYTQNMVKDLIGSRLSTDALNKLSIDTTSKDSSDKALSYFYDDGSILFL